MPGKTQRFWVVIIDGHPLMVFGAPHDTHRAARLEAKRLAPLYADTLVYVAAVTGAAKNEEFNNFPPPPPPGWVRGASWYRGRHY